MDETHDAGAIEEPGDGARIYRIAPNAARREMAKPK
jgi:hypothetical protein